jgi:hypothetical protein
MKRIRYIVPSLILVGIVFALSVQQLATRPRVAAEPLSYEQTGRTEKEWISRGQEAAARYGMVGLPTHEAWALMTYGSYQTLAGGRSFDGGVVPRNHPVFVYQAVGDIPELNFAGSASGATDIAGLHLVLDASTGFVMGMYGYVENSLYEMLDLSFIPADL